MTLNRTFIFYALALVGFILLPQFIAVKYYLHLSILALIWVIAAQGQNLIQGYTGYVSIVQAGFMGIGAYSTALMGIHFNMPVWLSITLAPFVTAFFALLTGYPSLRVKGHYFAIVTLAFNMVIFIVLMNFHQLTQGEAGITGIPKPGGKEGLFNWRDREVYYYFVLIIAVLMTALAALIVRSRVGQTLIAIRQNEDLVGAIGIAAWKYNSLPLSFPQCSAAWRGRSMRTTKALSIPRFLAWRSRWMQSSQSSLAGQAPLLDL